MRNRDRLVALQRVLGLGPLTLYAGHHLWLNWPALAGREAWVVRVRDHGLGFGWGALAIGLFALHAGLGIARGFMASDEASRKRSRFQALTGALLAIFLVYHLTQVWPPPSGSLADAVASYDRLWRLLGAPWALGLYVLGSAALAFHLAHGWAGALEQRLSGALGALGRYGAGAAGFALFFLFLQLVGWFALGEAIVPLQPTAAEARALNGERD
jgi:succinate dehydrogenase/fumarate reductase cytochrome b subunit